MKTVKSFVMSFALSASIGLPLLSLSGSVAAGGAELVLDRVHIDVRDQASLQSGARTFVNQCMGCHSASLMRYSKLRDIGLTDQQIKDNLLFAGEKVGEMMNAGMTRKDGKEWFGAAPPDLSVEARSRGAEWLYTYLRTFYRDPSTTTGWNNLVFERVAMPHVLWPQSGQAVLEVKEFKTADELRAAQLQAKRFARAESVTEADGSHRYLLKTTRIETPGSQTALEFDRTVRDLVTFMVWMGEPEQIARKRLGVMVLMFLGLLIALTYFLKKEFWKDVH
jgi:ubiquinol-cytochrome c reductase cytochrome c1 subunit